LLQLAPARREAKTLVSVAGPVRSCKPGHQIYRLRLHREQSAKRIVIDRT